MRVVREQELVAEQRAFTVARAAQAEDPGPFTRALDDELHEVRTATQLGNQADWVPPGERENVKRLLAKMGGAAATAPPKQ